MVIKQLVLENFRSYKKRKLDFSPEVNLIAAPNTAGKSNLLESVFLLSSGSSARASFDREMIREGADLGFVIGGIGQPDRNLEVQLIAGKSSPNASSKRFKVNGVAKRLGDFVTEFHAVLFSPEDLNLVIGSPDLRRRFLDAALSGVEARYSHALREYEKVRRRRNKLFEAINEGEARAEELGFWDAKLLEFGVFLQDARNKFFDEINLQLSASGFQLRYRLSPLTAERLQEFRPREIGAGMSLIGPHRDDFEFTLTNQSGNQPVNLSSFGSRSEQRRAVLALKKAELEFIEGKIEDRPVLLLDDIFSELDEENRGNALGFLDRGQAILTTADLQQVPKEICRGTKMIKL